MTRYAAFLRGINLGNRRIKMDDLRAHFEALEGLDDVATFIASGNVVFDTDADDVGGLETVIEAHLREALGYEVDTFIRSLAELGEIDGLDLFTEAGQPGYKVHVMFLKQTARDGAEERLTALASDDDRFRVVGREVHWLRHGGLSDSKLMPADLERAVGRDTSTMRTMNTVRRLVARFAVGD